MLENDKIAVFEGKCRRFRILPKVESLTEARIIDQFGRKRCQKERKDINYHFLKYFLQKYLVAQERWAVKN